jgi:D-lactate dehydrogenase
MNICFIGTEPSERDFFEKKIRGHELHFFDEITEIDCEPEILSTFIYTRINAELLAELPALKLVATRSTTYDHIDLNACAERGVTVCKVSSYGDNTVAEHTFALILALARRLREIIDQSARTNFSYESIRGFELKNKTLGLIGMGRIGRQMVPLARAFGMEVVAHDPQQDEHVAAELGFRYVNLDYLLRHSHVISIHSPLLPSTLHILNREAFAKCLPGVLLVNTARGGIIDTEALVDALDKGIVAGAGLDVLEDERPMRQETSHIISDEIVKRMQASFSDQECRVQDPARVKELQILMWNAQLISRPNVIFTPHVAFNSLEAVERINQMTVENIEAFVAGTPINVVSK